MKTRDDNSGGLARPVEEIRRLKERGVGPSKLPWSLWGWAVLAAFGGSALFGMSAALAAGWPHFVRAALLIILPAGLGWCILGAGLVLMERRDPWLLAHACLVTMFWGEMRLLAAAAVNVAAAWRGGVSAETMLYLNGWFVLGSNLLMVLVLAVQLREVGIPLRRTFVWWMLFLNGGGLLGLALVWPFLVEGRFLPG